MSGHPRRGLGASAGTFSFPDDSLSRPSGHYVGMRNAQNKPDRRIVNVYEIINPSDPLSMLAPSLDVAAMAIAIASTRLGVTGKDGQSPVMFGWGEWLKGRGIDAEQWLADPEKLAQLAAALESVALGAPNDRADFDDAMAAITDEAKRSEFIAKRNDRRRSSINDIETDCHNLAKRLRAKLADVLAKRGAP